MSYVIPIGPYHPALEEPIHAKLITEGELIKDAEVFIGYNHRGIEKLATEKNFIQALVLVERVCGICSHSQAFTYSRCIETIAEIEVPRRGKYIRVIIAELERLHSHFLWLGIACHLVAHDSMFMYIWNVREMVMDILEEITGNRVNYGMVIIGGARRDIDDEKSEKVLKMLMELEVKLNRIRDILLNDKTIGLRTKGVGILTTEDAIMLGTVGPHARASGVDMDTRRDSPYSCYDEFEFDVPVVNSCDVFARIVVRVLESYESIKIIRQALGKMPEGDINTGFKLTTKVKAGQALCRHEAPRGQLVHKVYTDGGPNPKRVTMHVPTFKTASTISTMLKGNSVADAGLIVASIDPCFSCLDR